jgi:glycosyltransferase involved in cell wall biosynthesis
MSNIVCFTSLIPKEYRQYYFNNCIGALSNANNNFQWALVNGLLEHNCSVQLINSPNIGAYPTRFRKMITKSYTFKINYKSDNINVGLINLNIIKHLYLTYKLYRHIKKLEYFKNKEAIIIYDMYPPFLNVLRRIKDKNKNIKIILVIPDIHGFTSANNSFLLRMVQNVEKRVIDKNINHVDAFVLLTKYMTEKLPVYVRNKPMEVVEGILNSDNLTRDESKIVNMKKERVILYTGSLDLRHGIVNLIKAFVQADLSDCTLHICGDGDGKEYILKYINNYKSVKYLGQLSREEVLICQQNAYLLVNPRTSEGEFTKYSFPSKIIEYFASGTPSLLYKLKGIPQEYYNYCYFLEDESIDALSNKLIQLMTIDDVRMKEMALRAKNFVIHEKNSYEQAKKIIRLIDSIV